MGRNNEKYLSLLLRHQPELADLSMDCHGWVLVRELTEKTGISEDELKYIVKNSSKQRFAFSADGLYIRANQGHSLKDIDLELKAVKPPQVLYHGTGVKFMSSIKKSGICKQSRQHVHLSKDYDTALTVGTRHGKPVVIKVAAARMYEDGCEFYLSDNGVWLTDYVDVKYFEE